MTKNLETADRITKLILSVTTAVFYFAGVIEGPFARALMIISILVILIYAARIVFRKRT